MHHPTTLLKNLLHTLTFCISISWRASKKYTQLRLLLELISAVTPFLSIYISKWLLDWLAGASTGIPLGGMHMLLWLLAAYALSMFMDRWLMSIKQMLSSLHNDMTMQTMNMLVSRKTQELDISFYDSAEFYDMLSNAQRDSISLNMLTWFFVDLVRAGVSLIIATVLVLNSFPWMALLFIVVAIPSTLAEMRLAKVMYNWQYGNMNAERKMYYILSLFTNKQNAKDMRFYNLQDTMLARYVRLWSSWFKGKKKLTIRNSWIVLSLSTLPQVAMIALISMVCLGIMHQWLTLGDFSLYTGAAGQLMGAITAIISVLSQISENHARLTNFENFLKCTPGTTHMGTHKVAFPCTIEFQDVSFYYPGTHKKVLDGVSFVMNSGDKTAIVGSNGAGKTTVIKLLLGFYTPDSGRILLGGIPIQEVDLVEWHSRIGVIFQDFAGYSFTLRENVALSHLDRAGNDASISSALEQAGLFHLKDKMDQYLTRQFEEDGMELSGGEWQKVALARAFFGNHDFFILDEPSAALDPEAEYRMFERLATLYHDRGAIFISHRLSNTVMTDKILVLDNGKVVEFGSHEELLSHPGRYAYLFDLQASKYTGSVVKDAVGYCGH